MLCICAVTDGGQGQPSGCGRGSSGCISAVNHLCRRTVGVETFQWLPLLTCRRLGRGAAVWCVDGQGEQEDLLEEPEFMRRTMIFRTTAWLASGMQSR
jgi:hypothetical protein